MSVYERGSVAKLFLLMALGAFASAALGAFASAHADVAVGMDNALLQQKLRMGEFKKITVMRDKWGFNFTFVPKKAAEFPVKVQIASGALPELERLLEGQIVNVDNHPLSKQIMDSFWKARASGSEQASTIQSSAADILQWYRKLDRPRAYYSYYPGNKATRYVFLGVDKETEKRTARVLITGNVDVAADDGQWPGLIPLGDGEQQLKNLETEQARRLRKKLQALQMVEVLDEKKNAAVAEATRWSEYSLKKTEELRELKDWFFGLKEHAQYNMDLQTPQGKVPVHVFVGRNKDGQMEVRGYAGTELDALSVEEQTVEWRMILQSEFFFDRIIKTSEAGGLKPFHRIPERVERVWAEEALRLAQLAERLMLETDATVKKVQEWMNSVEHFGLYHWAHFPMLPKDASQEHEQDASIVVLRDLGGKKEPFVFGRGKAYPLEQGHWYKKGDDTAAQETYDQIITKSEEGMLRDGTGLDPTTVLHDQVPADDKQRIVERFQWLDQLTRWIGQGDDNLTTELMLSGTHPGVVISFKKPSAMGRGGTAKKEVVVRFQKDPTQRVKENEAFPLFTQAKKGKPTAEKVLHALGASLSHPNAKISVEGLEAAKSLVAPKGKKTTGREAGRKRKGG